MPVISPTFVWRPAAAGNFGYGRAFARDGRFTFHHVVGSAETAAITFATPGRQASATFTITNIPGVVMQHVHIDNTPFSDGNAESNARTISAEHHGDWRFGYRDETVIANAALLVAWLRQQGLISKYFRHWQVSQLGTACCCDLPCEEIWNRATALLGGSKPAPAAPGGVAIKWTRYPAPVEYVMQKNPTTLWRFDKTGWEQFGNGTKTFPKGERILIAGEGYNPVLDATYLVTEFSLTSKAPNGFNKRDLAVAPASAAVIEWADIKDVEYEFVRDADLWNFGASSWGDITSAGSFKKGDRVMISAFAKNTTLGASYAVTEYSRSTKATRGWNEKDLKVYVKPTPPLAAKPPVPEWTKNLKDVPDVKLIVVPAQTPIVDLLTGKTLKMLGQGTVVDAAKETVVGGKTYIISSWSAAHSAPQGILKTALKVPLAVIDKPKWLAGWEDIADVDMYVRADTALWNLVDSTVVKTLKRGEKVRVASTSEVFGQRYALTEYSTAKMEGRGIRLDDLDLKPVEDTPPLVVPIPETPAPVPAPETVEQRLTWVERALATLGIKKK